jgi:hypothetical protein
MESLGLKFSECYHILRNCVGFGPVWPLDNLCIASIRPSAIRMRNELLHSDGSPSVEYLDGTKCYTLNGIPVKDWHALTPAEKIDPKQVLAEENSDIRRELIRKLGIERMLAVLPNKRLDKREDYEVYSIDLGDGVRDARYLKMINPSIGVFHLEGIDPSCDTVIKALNWRNQNRFENAEILT